LLDRVDNEFGLNCRPLPGKQKKEEARSKPKNQKVAPAPKAEKPPAAHIASMAAAAAEAARQRKNRPHTGNGVAAMAASAEARKKEEQSSAVPSGGIAAMAAAAAARKKNQQSLSSGNDGPANGIAAMAAAAAMRKKAEAAASTSAPANGIAAMAAAAAALKNGESKATVHEDSDSTAASSGIPATASCAAVGTTEIAVNTSIEVSNSRAKESPMTRPAAIENSSSFDSDVQPALSSAPSKADEPSSAEENHVSSLYKLQRTRNKQVEWVEALKAAIAGTGEATALEAAAREESTSETEEDFSVKSPPMPTRYTQADWLAAISSTIVKVKKRKKAKSTEDEAA